MLPYEPLAALVLAFLVWSAFAVRATRRARALAESDLNVTLSAAAFCAKELGHDHFGPEHFVLAAICDEEVARAHVGSDAGVAWLRSALHARLDSFERRAAPRPRVAPPLAVAVRRGAAAAQAQGRALPNVHDVMRELASPDAYEVSTLLARAREQRDTVPPAPESTRNVSATPYRTHEPAKAQPVVLWNDDATKMELVVAILREVFHKTETEAVHVMLTVHVKGRAIVGRYDPEDAARLAEAASARARNAGAPLRVTVGEAA